VPRRLNSAQEILSENAELLARVKLAERLAAERAAALEALQRENAQLKSERTHYCERVVLLEEELRWMKSQYFGSSSQKTDAAAVNPDQAMLFNEVEVLAAIEAAEEAHRQRTTKVDAHERQHTGGRKAIPKHFPRIEITHDLPEAQKICTKCAVPHPLTRLSPETRECYRYQPPKISVELHIRWTYVCAQRHEDVITAPSPPTLLPKTMASPSLLAHLITAKFDDGIPLYRVSRQLERSGMDLSPGTAGTWVNKIGGDKVLPLIELMREAIFVPPFMHMDESYLQVLKSEKAPTSTHYMVVRAAGPPGKRIILYDYIPSRTKEALKQLLVRPEGPYRGKLLTDGLEHYDEICQELQLLHFGCWQHLRAYFFKARKVSQLPSSRTLASTAIDDYIRRVFAVETEIETLRAEYEQRGETLPLSTIHALRQNKSRPVVEKFKEWVDQLLPGTPPNSALGKALGYCTRQWSKLVLCLDHAEVPIHNNFVERQIKQYALGRKSWMFCYDKVGAQASANLYSLVMTARANGVEPFEYLSHLFEHLPSAATVEAIEALLPWNLKPVLDARCKRQEAGADRDHLIER
jgi:transposase